MRETPAPLLELFNEACATPSDINEHLPLLRQLASECEHVTEFGMRSGISTIALLAGQPATLISWDINPMAIIAQHAMNMLLLAGRTSFQPRVGDTLKIVTEPTDMLFIDSLHTARQLRDELVRHADRHLDDGHIIGDRVRKYLAFHDTETFGMKGEDGKEPGLRAALIFYQTKHMMPLWELVEERKNNNGLVVFKHVCADGHSPSRHHGCCTWCAARLDS